MRQYFNPYYGKIRLPTGCNGHRWLTGLTWFASRSKMVLIIYHVRIPITISESVVNEIRCS